MLASEGFVDAHRLQPGDQVPAVINGRLRRLRIVGVALSPEYVYSISPGELVPDQKRFGVFWMEERALAAAFDMEGGIQRCDAFAVAWAVGRRSDRPAGQNPRAVRRPGRYSPVAAAVALDSRERTSQLQTFGFMLPLIFLMVAAFILNVALTRALALQRPQIASLKALGHDNAAIGWHYLKWAFVIERSAWRLAPLAARCSVGMLITLYNDFFRFPELLFSVPANVLVGATTLTMIAAGAGAFVRGSAGRAACLPPRPCARSYPPATGERRWRRRSCPAISATREGWFCETCRDTPFGRRRRFLASRSPSRF